MKVYQAMIEEEFCTNDPPCHPHEVRGKGRCRHPKEKRMIPLGDIADKRTGPQARCSGYVNRGTFAMVYEAEIGEWKPMLSDDEQAALRIGGTKALRKILDAKDRAERGAQPRRPTVQHAPTDRQVCVERGVGADHVWCICGKVWAYKQHPDMGCSRLKRVIAEQARKEKQA